MGLGLGLAVISAALAQPSRADPDDPESTLVAELVVVAPTRGPAWWKVSKGASVVWILGWPPTVTPKELRWDRSTLERRLRGATALLAPLPGTAEFSRKWDQPLPEDLAARLRSAAPRYGLLAGATVTAHSVLLVRDRRRQQTRLDFTVPRQIEEAAARAGVPIVRPAPENFTLDPDKLPPTEPEVAACLSAMMDEIETPPQAARIAAAHWAAGRVERAIAAAPRDAWTVCTVRFAPGRSRRLIEVQTAAIARALETPGKTLAMVPMRQLVAEEGVLQRLRAQGYTVADPARPLSE